MGNFEDMPSCCLHCLSCFHMDMEFKSSCLCRVLGHVAFTNQLLARYGTVVTITYNPESSTAKSMADDTKAAVEARTGLPLDSFRS